MPVLKIPEPKLGNQLCEAPLSTYSALSDLNDHTCTVSQGADQMPCAVTVEASYRTEAMARCIEMHAHYYARAVGFERSFEAMVASGLAEFSGRTDYPCNGLWLAMRDERMVDTVAIDGEDLGAGIAHLRWFIVDDDARGGGAGRRYCRPRFCEQQGFDGIHFVDIPRFTRPHDISTKTTAFPSRRNV